MSGRRDPSRNRPNRSTTGSIMARILITTVGTLGDVIPFVRLARVLASRGHRITMALNPALEQTAREAGLETMSCGRPYGPDEVRKNVSLFDPSAPPDVETIRRRFRELQLDRTFHDLVRACQNTDLLLSASLQGVASWVHERTDIPWINATIFAAEFPHADDPPKSTDPYNIQFQTELYAYRNSIRHAVGLPPVADKDWVEHYWSRRLVLLASSPRFSQPILDTRPQVRMTGFWLEEPHLADPSDVSPDLRSFLREVPAPLVFTLSSQPVRDPAAVVSTIALAAAKAGQRLIIQRGWAGLSPDHLPRSVNPKNVLFAGHAPHSWLFSHASAVIHHGGIGSTAEALRAGRPQLVTPFGNDQFFNARRIASLGVGDTTSLYAQTPDALSQFLEERVLIPTVIRKARGFATQLKKEQGLTTSADLIEAELDGHASRL